VGAARSAVAIGVGAPSADRSSGDASSAGWATRRSRRGSAGFEMWDTDWGTPWGNCFNLGAVNLFGRRRALPRFREL
jgi:hypothetical protein